MEQTVLQRPEILAPAGNADMLRAAVFAGLTPYILAGWLQCAAQCWEL